MFSSYFLDILFFLSFVVVVVVCFFRKRERKAPPTGSSHCKSLPISAGQDHRHACMYACMHWHAQGGPGMRMWDFSHVGPVGLFRATTWTFFPFLSAWMYIMNCYQLERIKSQMYNNVPFTNFI